MIPVAKKIVEFYETGYFFLKPPPLKKKTTGHLLIKQKFQPLISAFIKS